MSVAMPYPKPIMASQQVPIEYPKYVEAPNDQSAVVNSKEEEAEFWSSAMPLLKDDNTLVPPTRAELIARAQELGIKVDGRWAEGRIMIAIEMAEVGRTGA